MAIECTNFFHSKAFKNFPKFGFLVWKHTIWQPWLRLQLNLENRYPVENGNSWSKTGDIVLPQLVRKIYLSQLVRLLNLSRTTWIRTKNEQEQVKSAPTDFTGKTASEKDALPQIFNTTVMTYQSRSGFNAFVIKIRIVIVYSGSHTPVDTENTEVWQSWVITSMICMYIPMCICM
jgi:hypothetical protein